MLKVATPLVTGGSGPSSWLAWLVRMLALSTFLVNRCRYCRCQVEFSNCDELGSANLLNSSTQVRCELFRFLLPTPLNRFCLCIPCTRSRSSLAASVAILSTSLFAFSRSHVVVDPSWHPLRWLFSCFSFF